MKINYKKTKFLISLILLTMLVSCKKGKIEAIPKTVADFEKSMVIDKDFITFNETTLEMMNNMKADDAGSLLTNYRAKPRKEYSDSEIKASLASIKTKDDLLVLFQKLNVANPEKIVALGEQQGQAYMRFIQNNPDFVNLPLEDRQALIGKTVRDYQSAHASIITFSSKRNQKGILVADPLYIYNVQIAACDSTYLNAVDLIWATADANMIANAFYSAGAGIPLIMILAIAAHGYAANAHNNCYDVAAAVFFDKIE